MQNIKKSIHWDSRVRRSAERAPRLPYTRRMDTMPEPELLAEIDTIRWTQRAQ
jgi:hypothetical protein